MSCLLTFSSTPFSQVCRNGSFHLKGNVYVHYRSLESAILAYQSINGRYFAGKPVSCEFVNISRWKVAICGEYMKSRLKTCSHGSACNFIHCFRNPGGDYEWADHDKPPPRFWVHKMTALFGYSDEYLEHMDREYSGTLNDLRSDLATDSHRQRSRRSRSRDHDRVIGSKPSYKNRKNHGDVLESTRGSKLSRRQDENRRHDGSESPSSSRESSLEREVYRERRYTKETARHESKWSEHSPGHGVTMKKIHGRYSDDDSPDGDDNGRRETGHKRKARRGTDSEVEEQMDNEKDIRTRRSSRKYNREGSSADQEDSYEHDKVHAVCDKSHRERSKHRHERSSSRCSHEGDLSESKHHTHKGSDLQDYGEYERKRSVKNNPREDESDKDRDKSKQRHRYRTRDPDSDGSRKGKGHGRSSGSGASVRESQELNGNGKRENVSGSLSDEDREKTHKERPHRHKKRRSQHSHDQTYQFAEKSKEVKEEIERWRPM
ncbi:Zinc finger CCCH domain-containing protein 5 [Cardamine amara subsp. amara]|uniref:Zinc finger CCCH domain-containing protein 5 n=1 Tax=Cardamine amara subsp. amara TaxID=228776 RepID=A0ABD1BZY5_CARAN